MTHAGWKTARVTRLCSVLRNGEFFLVCLAATQLRAQSATLVGTVFRDSAGSEVGGAEVSLPALSRATTSNYRGEFRLDGLPPGKHVIAIRRVGFAAYQDTVQLLAAQITQREFILRPVVASLDSVVVTAQPRKYISPGLRGFEDRRVLGFGHFIDEGELRKNDERPLSSLLTQLPGGRAIYGPQGAEFFVSTRKPCRGRALSSCARPNCFVTVFLNGALIYSVGAMPLSSDGRSAPENQPPDVYRIRVKELAGVEFYPSDSSIPAEFRAGDSGCGTLLLWSRER
jgi:hypothetical protein